MKNDMTTRSGLAKTRQQKAVFVLLLLSPLMVNSQSLEEAVATTLSSHPDIRQAYSQFKVKEKQVDQAESGYLPTVDVTAGYGVEYTNSPGIRRAGASSENLNRGEFGISLKQSLFSGFETQNEVDRTTAEVVAEQWRLLNTAENIALDVTKGYVNLLRTAQLLELSEKNLDSHKLIFDQIQQRTKSGLGSIADLSQITGRLAQANSNVISAKNNYLDAKAQFMRITGVPPEALVVPIPDAELLPVDLDSGIELATSQHPLVISAQQDILAARFQHSASQSSYYPKVSFDLDANFNNDLDGEDGNGVGGHNNDVVAMVRVSYNLFAGGKDKARIEESAYRIGQANEINRNVQRQIIEGYTLAWQAYDLLNQQKQYIQAHVVASKQSQSAYEQQFKLGQRTLLDLLDTENELFQSRKSFVDAEYSELTAQYRLLNATGQLLDSLRVTRPVVWQGEKQYQGGISR